MRKTVEILLYTLNLQEIFFDSKFNQVIKEKKKKTFLYLMFL